ncbi:restriction endonuclease [Candidatus Bathyarchaeota archaeon]|nr:restriction endonuclease [Candidatus Bathyarchaeota archaeon]
MSINTITLNELAAKYFRKKGYKIEQTIILEGASGIPHKFNLLITKSNEKRVVKILNWKRTVGVNIVINFDKASEDVGVKKPIVISEKFSSHAKAYANRKGVTLLTRQKLNKY